MKSIILSLLLSILVSHTCAQPAPGKLWLGAWLSTTDSPKNFNERMGFEASFFQYNQSLPLGNAPFPYDQVRATNTSAAIVLTINPSMLTNVPELEIQKLADQCAQLTLEAKRRLLIQFGPEMNGNWRSWGQKPTQFVALWTRVHRAVRAKAPSTKFIWTPMVATGYPWGQVSVADVAALDTNKDGVVNDQDDAFYPYYPGDEHVDWIGMAVYTYGSTYPWSDNISAPAGKFQSLFNHGNFYQTYAVSKNKPLMITETGAAYHVNTPLGPGVGELTTKRSWWRQFLTNSTFLQSHPLLKAICLYEVIKYEDVYSNGEPSLRDFRISTKTDIRIAFLDDFTGVKSLFELERNRYTNPLFSTDNLIVPDYNPSEIHGEWSLKPSTANPVDESKAESKKSSNSSKEEISVKSSSGADSASLTPLLSGLLLIVLSLMM